MKKELQICTCTFLHFNIFSLQENINWLNKNTNVNCKEKKIISDINQSFEYAIGFVKVLTFNNINQKIENKKIIQHKNWI